MIEVNFDYYGETVKGVLLCKYQRLHDETFTTEHKFLWWKKTIVETKKVLTPLYVIFIPWKHREKEIVEVPERCICNLHLLSLPDDWQKIDHFVSKAYDGDIYHASVDVENFVGYPFIGEYNGFVINMVLYEHWDNLEVLYKNMPELATLDLDNQE